VGVISVLAAGAAAAAPLKSEFIFSDDGVLEDVCAFPVAVHATGTATETDFFDASGTLTGIQLHATEQTTYSAHGITLTTVPFTYTSVSASMTAASARHSSPV